MTTHDWVNIDLIDSRVRGRLKLYNEQGRIDPDDIVSNTVEGMKSVGGTDIWDEKWTCVNVVNHKGIIPTDIYKVILSYKLQNANLLNTSSIFQIVTNVSTSSSTVTDSNTCDPITTSTTTTVTEAEDCNTGEAVLANVANNKLQTTELVKILNDSKPMYYGGSNLNLLADSSSNIFIDNCDSYILRGNAIITSFQSGTCLINYLGENIGDDGRPLIPNDEDLINALVAFNIFRIIEEDFYNRVEGIGPIYAEAKTNWENFRAFSQNNSKLITPQEAYAKAVDTSNRYERFRLR